LAKFKTNLTAEVKAEITASKDIKATVIDSIIGYANTFSNENITQETYKSNSKNITAEGVTELNAVYTAVVTDFSKLVLDFYKKKKSAKKDLFSYTAIVKTVSNTAKATTPPPATPK
jgi:methyltransferase-like protein